MRATADYNNRYQKSTNKKRGNNNSIENYSPAGLSLTNRLKKPSFSAQKVFFINPKSTLRIKSASQKNSFKIDIGDKNNYLVNYPTNIFSSLSPKNKKVLVDNYIYCRTRSLSLITDNSILYQTTMPFWGNLIHHGLIKDLPRITFSTNLRTQKLITQFQQSQKNNQIFFQNKKIIKQLLPTKSTSNKKVILAMSFGKDSLLVYGLAKELGLNCHLVFINEMEKHNSPELKFKRQIIKLFSQKQKEKINFMTDNVDEIFYSKKFKNNIGELESTNAMLAFTLELIPFAYYYRAKYLLVGNEHNFEDYFLTPDGFKIYPSYDQSSAYTNLQNKYLSSFTQNNWQVVSLIEPIYNIAEMQVLYHRYPYLLKYVMSCYPGPSDPDRWCYRCPMCAKAFLYSAAVGGDPQKIGFNKNLFAHRYQNLYPLFTKKISRVYEKPPTVREEQLLAFLLAYQQGYRGSLIELFKLKYLKEAKKREKELRKKYFGIYTFKNIPSELKNKLANIYQQELKNLQ